MRQIILSVVVCFCPYLTAVIGQTMELELWPGLVPGKSTEKSAPIIKPNRGDEVTRITNITDPTLRIYPASVATANGMGVIVCPGGGHRHLAIDKEGYEVAEWLNTLGITAFVLTYRVPDQVNGAIQDLHRALRLVRQSAAKWNIHLDKLGVIGFSAGAHLAVLADRVSSKPQYPTVDEVDDLSCKQNFTMLVYPGLLTKGPDDRLNPDALPGRDTPPSFIFATADDRLAGSALVYAKALRQNRTPVTLHLLPEGGHGYGLRPGNLAAEAWPKLAADWLAQLAD
ncbi:MAG: alpha/beta hydrolase [Saprospiraceae bacterium]|nr:alpha/beta hydrolase [Saprospiraceae bacterium]